jgi:hypothetical protein
MKEALDNRGKRENDDPAHVSRGDEGKARQGKARQGKARQGKARQGKARQGCFLTRLTQNKKI